jgi:hypothetical protein
MVNQIVALNKGLGGFRRSAYGSVIMEQGLISWVLSHSNGISF